MAGIWLYFGLLAGLVLWGGYLGWRWHQTRVFAAKVLALRQASGEIPIDVERAEFEDLYVRAEGPRAGTYLFVCATVISLSLMPMAALFDTIWEAAWRATGQDPVYGRGTLIHTFSFFLTYFGMVVSLLAAAMHRYHALAPPNLRQVIRELSNPVS